MIEMLPTAEHLSTLLRLLDDDSPEVRDSLRDALAVFRGDVSELLEASSSQLPPHALQTLSDLLAEGRRERIAAEWVVPVDGAEALDGDWESFEGYLRMISDFLHDGVTLRQSLADALDLLAEEAEDSYFQEGPAGLCRFLLQPRRLHYDFNGFLIPEHYDLARLVGGGGSNATGLIVTLILVGRRLGAEISAMPPPFENWARLEAAAGGIRMVDPAARGRLVNDATIDEHLAPGEDLELASQPLAPGDLLTRFLDELALAFELREKTTDHDFVSALRASL